MKSFKTSCHVADVAAAASSRVHVTCVMTTPVPVIREPSFKSELHIPIVPANRTKRLSPQLHSEIASPAVSGENFFLRKVAKRLPKDKNNRGSSESLNCSLRGSQDDMISLRSFRDGTLSPFINKSPVWFRKKYVERQESQRRQVACKDLGGADCEGWLWKKHEGSGHKTKKWVIRWFMLDRKKLRYYKHEDDDEPQGVIHLLGLKISPAPEIKHKKFAFKAYHTGTKFFFAAENQDDMVKWMNKMGLASLEDLDLSRSSTTAGFQKADKLHLDVDDTGDDASSSYRSDSDAESLESLGGSSRLSSRRSSQRSSFASSREDLVDLYDKLYKANIGLDGSNISERRSTVFFAAVGHTEEEEAAYCRLLTLRRTLQDKEEQLKAITDLLQAASITSEDIALFRESNPILVAELEDKNKTKCKSNEVKYTCSKDGGSDDTAADPESTASSEKTELSGSAKSSDCDS